MSREDPTPLSLARGDPTFTARAMASSVADCEAARANVLTKVPAMEEEFMRRYELMDNRSASGATESDPSTATC